VNGDFDQVATAWMERSSNGFDLVCADGACGDSISPLSGSHLAWLGGADSEKSHIWQRVDVPAGAPLTLEYWYNIESEDICGYDFAKVLVKDKTVGGGNRTLVRYDLCDESSTSGWQPAAIDLSEYAGHTILVRFWTKTDSLFASSFYVDGVRLVSGSSCNLSAAAMAPASGGLDETDLSASVLRLDAAAREPQADAALPAAPIGVRY
jgi:bacillopeptidase F (M6 metalloprotease family)